MSCRGDDYDRTLHPDAWPISSRMRQNYNHLRRSRRCRRVERFAADGLSTRRATGHRAGHPRGESVRIQRLEQRGLEFTSPNAVATTLPPDTFGNTTLVTYDNGQLCHLAAESGSRKSVRRCSPWDCRRRSSSLAPQRVIGQLQYQNIVQVVSYQRPGAAPRPRVKS